MTSETGMSGLQRKKLALKALKELKRTNPDACAAKLQEKTERQSQFKRYLVQIKRGDIWQTLDTTDHQGEAVQAVMEFRWAKTNPSLSWKVIDTEWLKTNRGKSVVMWIKGDEAAGNPEDGIIPTAPLFPLESFVRVDNYVDPVESDDQDTSE